VDRFLSVELGVDFDNSLDALGRGTSTVVVVGNLTVCHFAFLVAGV
jgi:hypothetical protein